MASEPYAATCAPAVSRGPLRIALIAKPGGSETGVGRYVQMIGDGLRVAGTAAARVATNPPPLPAAGYAAARRAGIDLSAFFQTYPVWATYPPADIYHLTSQNLATLLLFRRPPGRVVVTVHDIIPYMLRTDPRLCTYRGAADRLFDRLAMAGLRRADVLLADSAYTQGCLETHLGIRRSAVEVVHLGIDHRRFTRTPADGVKRRYGLPDGRRFVIYVGSEDPRKNLDLLLRAVAELRRALPDVELLKVGRAHFAAERVRLQSLANELGIGGAIHWLDDVPEADLAPFYSLADVCAMPSLYEGFGFPVLEALSCGTPVVCADAASLPELAGAVAALVPPADVPAMAAALHAAIATSQEDAAQARRRAHARTFDWQQTVGRLLSIYRAAVSA